MSLMQPFIESSRDPFITDFLERWETSRRYTLAVAKAMPESEYQFKPAPDTMSFAEQLMHIAAAMEWQAFSKIDGEEFETRWDDYRAEGLSKEEIIAIVDREFDRAQKLMTTFDPGRLDETGQYDQFTRTRRQFFMLLADHITHHRGQMLVYLRLKGITPPDYVDFQ